MKLELEFSLSLSCECFYFVYTGFLFSTLHAISLDQSFYSVKQVRVRVPLSEKYTQYCFFFLELIYVDNIYWNGAATLQIRCEFECHWRENYAKWSVHEHTRKICRPVRRRCSWRGEIGRNLTRISSKEKQFQAQTDHRPFFR